MSVKQADAELGKRDLYEVLGIDRLATQEGIKSAYKKAALKHHPDKNAGPGAEVAAARFQEVSSAYAVLSDPTKRARYDSKGFSGLEPNELDAEIDVSSLGLFGTVAAAMFSKLGVPIKTSIAASVLEEAYEGRFKAEALTFGEPISTKMEKAQAVFFRIAVTQEQIDRGFVIGATSSIGSKFKILLFEHAGESGRWELQAQEDSLRTQSASSMAALFFLEAQTYRVGPKPVMEMAKNPEAQLFLRLEAMIPREPIPVKPGSLLIAFYNDNWFKRAQILVAAELPSQKPVKRAALADLQEVEKKLLEKQSTIRAFEAEFKQAQEQWKRASEKYAALSKDVEATLLKREEAYRTLIGGPDEKQGSELSQPPLFSGWGVKRRS